jgi:hypothetical protein
MKHAPPLPETSDDATEIGPRLEAAALVRRFQRVLEQLRRSRDSGDGRLILLTEEAASLAAMPGQPERVTALLELARIDPWQVCLTVGNLARHAGTLEDSDLTALVRHCREILEVVPPDDREGLLEDLAHQGHHRFLRKELELELAACPVSEVAPRFAAGLRRLPPSARAQLDLDALVRLCLDRMGPDPLASWLDHLLQTVALRDLRDDALRETLADAYARALDPGDIEARHRDRLLYLSRYAIDPVIRARLEVRHDLARLAALPRDVGLPELVLEPLTRFPAPLTLLPEREAQAVIGFVLRRLVRRLSEEDHLRIGRTLCDPARPEPFFTAYQIHLKTITLRASTEVQLEVWGEFFSAWLSHRAGELGPVLRPFLRSVARGLEREVRAPLDKVLRRRFGDAFRALWREAEESESAGWRWRWPWSSRPSV